MMYRKLLIPIFTLMLFSGCDEVPNVYDEVKQGLFYVNGEDFSTQDQSVYLKSSPNFTTLRVNNSFKTYWLTFETENFRLMDAINQNVNLVIRSNSNYTQGFNEMVSGKISVSNLDFNGLVTLNGSLQVYQDGDTINFRFIDYKVGYSASISPSAICEITDLNTQETFQGVSNIYSDPRDLLAENINGISLQFSYLNLPNTIVEDTSYYFNQSDINSLKVFGNSCEIIPAQPLELEVFEVTQMADGSTSIKAELKGEIREYWDNFQYYSLLVPISFIQYN